MAGMFWHSAVALYEVEVLNISKQVEHMISVGIDIGTSTTKLVISQLGLANVAGGGRIPKIEIVDKKVMYESPIYRTPLISPLLIDMETVVHIVENEYIRAGIEKDSIRTGAVIITGETAVKRNAEEVVHHLAHSSGEFLVATAGPDLEAIIAAKGSGAMDYSRTNQKTVANIDIGGGTANIAVYKNGELSGTCTLHIGGRLIEWKNGKFIVSPSIRAWLDQRKLSVTKGNLSAITGELASVLARFLEGTYSESDHLLLLGKPPIWSENIDVLFFSGGISECMYNRQLRSCNYQDIGINLAESLLENELLKQWKHIRPQQTVRATVLGAGMQMTEISGSTIEADDKLLPVRNMPICSISFNSNFRSGLKDMPLMLKEGFRLHDAKQEGRNVAIYLKELPFLNYRQIQELANQLIAEAETYITNDEPLVIVLTSDYGKVLGQSIRALSKGRKVICIDQIEVEQGDYLDIGRVLQSGVVPVVVKTLVFQNGERGR